MTRIESDTTVINQSPENVFTFLSDFNNFKQLMPEQVENWTSTENECRFTIKGMATLGMKMSEKKPGAEIKIVNNGKAPFDFELYCMMKPADNAEQCYLQMAFNAELNPFLEMMAQKPLRNFLNMLVENYKKMADL